MVPNWSEISLGNPLDQLGSTLVPFKNFRGCFLFHKEETGQALVSILNELYLVLTIPLIQIVDIDVSSKEMITSFLC